MTTPAHTPGPWRYAPFGELGDWEDVYGADGVLVCRMESGPAEDNAALIAAAPDLLVTLMQMLEAYEGHLNEAGYNPDQSSVVIAAREAIANATGK